MQVEENKRLQRGLIPPALRYPAYRAYWLGSLASVSGFQMFQFGQLWLVHQLTGSPLFLGYVGLANAVPAIVLNLVGGVFADKLDQRRLIMATQTTTAGLIFLLATLTLLDRVAVWHVLVIAFFAGAVNAFDQPARQALYPHLIDRQVIPSAVALNSSIWQGTRIVAPAIAGVVIAVTGTASAFYLAGVGFFTMAVVMVGIQAPRPTPAGGSSAAGDLVEGVTFIRRNSIFSFLIGMTFFNSFFGMSFIFLMPVFAVDVLGVGSDGQGALVSASGVGALLTTLWLGSRSSVRHRGLLIIGGAVMFGLLVAAFGLTSRYFAFFPLALAIMFALGIANSTYMISVQSALQVLVPNRMRGRVMGFYSMTWSILPLGGMQAGALASFISAPLAVAVGGLAVTAFAIGPAVMNRGVRRLGDRLAEVEARAAGPAVAGSPSPSATDD